MKPSSIFHCWMTICRAPSPSSDPMQIAVHLLDKDPFHWEPLTFRKKNRIFDRLAEDGLSFSILTELSLAANPFSIFYKSVSFCSRGVMIVKWMRLWLLSKLSAILQRKASSPCTFNSHFYALFSFIFAKAIVEECELERLQHCCNWDLLISDKLKLYRRGLWDSLSEGLPPTPIRSLTKN